MHTSFFRVSLCQENLDLTINLIGPCNLGDVLLGLNREGRRRELHTHSAMGNMATQEGETIQGKGGIYKWNNS